jgi:hypothetical protein
MTPAWVNPDQRYTLNPPAEVRKLGDLPRHADNLVEIADALHYPEATRYKPGTGGGDSWCNLATIDFCCIAQAPLPRMLNGTYQRANDLADLLAAGRIDGWSPVGTLASASAIIALANDGRPQVAVYRAPGDETGHIMPVVAAPAGAKLPPHFSGVFVSGAGAICVHRVPIEKCFGRYSPEVKVYAYRQ